MGLFDKKKNKEAPAAAPQKTPSPDAEPLLVQPSLDRLELLDIVSEACPGFEKQGEWLLYRRHMLRLTVEFGQMQCIRGSYNIQLLFIAQHPWFDEDLVESVAGFGENPDDAMRRGTEQFCAGVLRFLLAAFDCGGEQRIEADVMGKKHSFRLPCAGGGLHMGEGESTDLYALVKDKLPEYLGTKRCYWVKLFSSVMDGKPICEARINGTVYPGLTELLYQEAAQRRSTVRFSSDKEFLLLIQDEETWSPCPFTKQEVGELVFRGLRLLTELDNGTAPDQIMSALRNEAPNRSLGIELSAFIPEIVCQQVVQFLDNDGLMPVVNYGNPDAELKKSQVRSYGYIEDAVFQYLRKQKPSEDGIKLVLAMSGKFHTISEAMQKGVKLEDLRLSQLVYFVDENYEVW